MIHAVKKIVMWVIAAIFAAFIALFSLANRTSVGLDLWPLAITQEVPIFTLILVCLGFGILWGGFAAWLSAGTARRRARAATRRAEAAEADLRHAAERLVRLEQDLKALRASDKASGPIFSGPGQTALLPKSSDAA